MYDVTIGNDSASLGSERTDIMNTKGKKPKRKVKMDYGDGSIYFVKSRNCYAGQVYLEIDGEKIRKSVYGKTERIVKDKIRELQIQAKAGAFKKVDKTTFYELAEKMIEEQIDLNEIRQSTYKRKLETLKMLAPLSDKQLRKITEDDIVAYFKDNLDYAQSTLNKLYQLLGAVFKKAIKKGIIDKSPLEDLRVPKSRKKTDKVRALTVEEQARLLDVLNNNDINYSEIMLVSMFTGMRGGEICALNIEDIDFQNSCIIVNKTTSRGGDNSVIVNETKTEAGMRKVLINNDLAAFLKECIGERTGGTLFVSSNNKPVTTQQVNYYFWNTLKQYDIQDKSLQGKLTFHSLRHTFATRCIESGVPPKVLQKILGHKDISVTMNVYCDVFEKFEAAHLNAVDEYMKLNNIGLGKPEAKTVKVA